VRKPLPTTLAASMTCVKGSSDAKNVLKRSHSAGVLLTYTSPGNTTFSTNAVWVKIAEFMREKIF
jgi:hypothetical protein